MLKRTGTLLAAAIAVLALPAAAGSWPNLTLSKAPLKAPIAVAPQSATGFVAGMAEESGASLEQYTYVFGDRAASGIAQRASPGRAPEFAANGGGFEFIAGETGWQPGSHKLVWHGGRFAHSDECDHVIRTARGPTAAELERSRLSSPGS